MAEDTADDEVILERFSNDTKNLEDPEWVARVGELVDPMLSQLQTSDTPVNKEKIKDQFIRIWDLENADSMEADEQFLTRVGLFIYCSHMELDEYNIKVDQARDHINAALHNWIKPEIDKQIAEEKRAENPFKAFVDSQQPRVDNIYTWRHFLLEHKKASDKEWTYKMKQCWFSRFFIRYGRTDLTLTACQFDKIPAEARRDYVSLKLTNQFPKWGTSCTFQYQPPQG